MSDYVVRAQGARTTPHSDGPGKGRHPEGPSRTRLRSLGSRSPGNPACWRSSQHAMCWLSTIAWREQWHRYGATVDRLPLVPFKTPFSALFRVFRAFRLFRRIQAALAYPLDRNCRNGGK